MLLIPSSSKRTRSLGLAVLAVTFVVGGLSGMALQQTRAASETPEPADAGVLMVEDASGALRPCPPPRQRFEPLDSIGASQEQQDSIESIIESWMPKMGQAVRQYRRAQDSLYADYEARRDAIQDSSQTLTRAVLTAEQRAALEALYARRDSTRRAVRAEMEAFEDRCREARRQSDGDRRRGDGDRSQGERAGNDTPEKAMPDTAARSDGARDKQH